MRCVACGTCSAVYRYNLRLNMGSVNGLFFFLKIGRAKALVEVLGE